MIGWLAGWVLAASAGDVGEDPAVRDAVAAFEVWAEYQAATARVPGMSYAIVHDQEVVHVGAFGWLDREAKIEATPETRFGICSISKVFTAVSVLQLRDEGKLRLDDPLADHLAWFDLPDSYPDDRPIDLRSVLTHSAGLPREAEHGAGYWMPDTEFPTRKQLKKGLAAQATLYPTQRYFQYSNLGLSLVGEAVAEVAGQSYDKQIRARILDPLGMSATTTAMPKKLLGKELAVGYAALDRNGERVRLDLYDAKAIAPAAGFGSTAGDLARFVSWQLRARRGEANDVLAGASLREMQRVHFVDPDWSTTWGLGFAVREVGGRTLVGHNGLCPGYSSAMWVDPEAEIGVIVLANAISAPTYRLTTEAFKVLRGPIGAAAKRTEPAAAPTDDLDQYVGIYDYRPWGEAAIVRWKGGLGMLWLADRSIDALQFNRVSGHGFRRVRDDGEPGEMLTFTVDADGNVVDMHHEGNTVPRVR